MVQPEGFDRTLVHGLRPGHADGPAWAARFEGPSAIASDMRRSVASCDTKRPSAAAVVTLLAARIAWRNWTNELRKALSAYEQWLAEGEKTAAQLLVEHGTLDNLLAHADAIKGKRGENIRAAIGTLPLSRTLVTLASLTGAAPSPSAWRTGLAGLPRTRPAVECAPGIR